MKNILENKNCLITGVTGGIGREIAKQFASSSCNLFLTARDLKKLNKLKSEIESEVNSKIKIRVFQADLTSDEDIKKLIFQVKKEFKKINILVNCAGKFLIKSVSESTVLDFDNSFQINIRAPFILTKEFSNGMKSDKWGRIINIGSSSAYSGFSKGSIYCASKHALLGLTRALQNELREYNIRTLFVSPGSTKTEMAKISLEQDFETFLDPKEVAKYISYIINFDNEMIIDESRLNRMFIK